MRAIILIGDSSLNIEAIKSIEHYGSTSRHDVPKLFDRHVVMFGNDYLFYDFADITGEYEDEELSMIPFDKPNFIAALYSDTEIMRQVVMQDNFLKDIYIDNTLGVLLPIAEFIRIGAPME